MEGEASEGKSGQCQWTPTQSSFMFTYLANIVANGTRTSSSFKKVHLNSCAKAVNEHFNIKVPRTGDQIANHLKTWKRKYTKINQLRKISAAIWDEDNFVISLDHERYTEYIEAHKADDEYLNKPLKYYGELATIFGNSVATGQYAKASNEPLAFGGGGIEENYGEENCATVTPDDTGATSSVSRPSKRAKIVESDTEGLIGAFDRASKRLSIAIKESAIADKAIPKGLFDTVNNLPGFEHVHKSLYYSYLVNNIHVARAFDELPFDHKLTWIAKWVTDNCP
ncbi:hypothetical protein BS78_K336700 [Paspalum vaginatum]|uniref:Myb/SANT-like domain-containing protein n=1 Tax=Paspalum vaginatum TaxID=158149 RepID=A0A9W8CEG8_9POAL|nr:hypothetical protein BS78_K336700 [Paspalum vaginatum]